LLADASKPYAEHTVVDQAVSACAADRELSRAKGVVNAVLRRFLRERDRLLRTANAAEETLWNYPQWWIDKLRNDWPNQWEDILQSGNARPPLTLRVNRRLGGVEDYLQLLTQQQLEATQLGPWAVRLTQPTPVSDIPGFLQGRVSVQDAAAQLAAPLMQLEPGMRVLDACAAPGGKSVHLLETEDISLVALDNDKSRLARVADNLDRLGFKAELLCGDARHKDWWDGQVFDRILADVPCTASGIVRRHPDIRWLRRPEDARALAKLGSAILDNLWSMLRPGGLMLFVTCSIWPEESELQAESFCQRHSCVRLPAPGQLAPKSADGDDHDGLFYALLQKPLF
jgi:16S rRNA (cytosine967-C5)-methyltransferase